VTPPAGTMPQATMQQATMPQGGYLMQHQRSDLALIPTALREQPTAKAKPLEVVKAEPEEEVLVHVQAEVLEGGKRTTWARISCKSGEGWLKREHLREVLTDTPSAEEIMEDGASAAPGSPRCDADEGGWGNAITEPGVEPNAVVDIDTGTFQPEDAPHFGPKACIHTVQAPTGGSLEPVLPPTEPVLLPTASEASLVQRWCSMVDAEKCEEDSKATPCGVRARLGTLELVASSVSSLGVFDQVGFRLSTQLGGFPHEGGPPTRWVDDGPATDLQSLRYRRAVSDDGRYEAKVVCDFDEAFDLPVPAGFPLPEKICVDVWLERTTVVDRFDQVLGTLGLHSPAGIDRQWLGRAVLDLPKDGVEDITSPCVVVGRQSFSEQGGSSDKGPVAKIVAVGVEWVTQPLDQD